ncbi:hypothetical protein [Arthrobacter sp. AQ5-05]|uniref:hypothetical protein n=1 Tax=Arthrobacter sp. AQ5-05 TaxID=2184581 RepID=UPI0011BEBEEA|nr:hypothetical protein [Arthrobacter sp. AQ5-05]
MNRYDKLALAYRSAVVLQAVVIWSAALEKSGLGHPRGRRVQTVSVRGGDRPLVVDRTASDVSVA